MLPTFVLQKTHNHLRQPDERDISDQTRAFAEISQQPVSIKNKYSTNSPCILSANPPYSPQRQM